MIVTFLGTGTSQGVPVIACDCHVCRSIDFRDNRTRTSVHIQVDGKSLVIDTGPDFREQVLRERINRLDAVIFTHQHKDHTGGLDEVRSFNFAQKMDMPIYATKPVIDQLVQDYGYIFTEKNYPGVPRVKPVKITPEKFRIDELEIVPIQLLHYKLPVLGFRIKDFTYITDANKIEDSEIKKISGSKILVINALQKEKHISHFNLEEALEIIARVNPKKAFLTHLSHKMGLHAEIEKELPQNVEVAYDGLKLNI